MFLREIEGSSKDAILIHVNGTTLRFTIRDFAIISGLKCSDNLKDFVFNTEEPNKIILQYFGVEKAITKSQLVEKKDFDLVESGRYIDYPWDKKAFDLLILHLHTKIKHDGKYFRLIGFPLALQVWFYECCSNFNEEIAVKVSHHIPRILNWKTKKDFPCLSYFAKGMFRDDNNPMEKHFTYLRNFIENNFKVVLDSIKSKNAEDKGDGVEVTDKVPVGVVQSEEPSQHLPSELNCQSVFNDLNDQEKVVRISVPSSTPEISIHQSNLHSPAGQSTFNPLFQQFSNPEPQGHNNSGVPINFRFRTLLIFLRFKTILRRRIVKMFQLKWSKRDLNSWIIKQTSTILLFNGNGVPNSFDSEFTRIQYASLLWNYGVQKIQVDATSDSEAPERPIRIHRDCDSSEKITIN
ncbi:hypothetical protein MTR67_053412 [Solanum verrucosum]|uniref:DUF1985 domain-containing protein n=1 Tax=Solanum verrucosum TaxID=315347 RepID=A0AAF0V8T0_SOLVR|nr:hypothetical protein MTR67_053412 [Solanum verrucosum]